MHWEPNVGDLVLVKRNVGDPNTFWVASASNFAGKQAELYDITLPDADGKNWGKPHRSWGALPSQFSFSMVGPAFGIVKAITPTHEEWTRPTGIKGLWKPVYVSIIFNKGIGWVPLGWVNKP